MVASVLQLHHVSNWPAIAIAYYLVGCVMAYRDFKVASAEVKKDSYKTTILGKMPRYKIVLLALMISAIVVFIDIPTWPFRKKRS
ncbi:hypothetical protein pEaSNUABM52_00303 [Erwinia phage pEp_SNUABM_52]|nr:hypothetical protein pEaSNUABM52_00303 [Erwinia phage pEp_SNUABM_52]